jgi:hypothetical protein
MDLQNFFGILADDEAGVRLRTSSARDTQVWIEVGYNI